ncbi:MAG: hypothetical protein AAF721_08195 [Myxococcota bacterium]
MSVASPAAARSEAPTAAEASAPPATTKAHLQVERGQKMLVAGGIALGMGAAAIAVGWPLENYWVGLELEHDCWTSEPTTTQDNCDRWDRRGWGAFGMSLAGGGSMLVGAGFVIGGAILRHRGRKTLATGTHAFALRPSMAANRIGLTLSGRF